MSTGSPRGSVHGLRRFPALLAGLGLVVAACTGSGFRYLKHDGSNTVFKLPENWRVFEGGETAVLRGGSGDGSSPEWLVAFDASQDAERFEGIGPSSKPRGMAVVRALSGEQRAAFSPSSLRNELIAVDLLEEQGVPVTLLDERKLTLDDGLHGERILFNIEVDDGVVTFNKTALVDGSTRTVFAFLVGCAVDCYRDNRDVIEEVVSSYTVGGSV